MTHIESLERDIQIAREHLLNSRTREEARERSNWLAHCKKRLANEQTKQGVTRK